MVKINTNKPAKVRGEAALKPVPHDPKRAEEILAWVGEGNRLIHWCKLRKFSLGSVYRWLYKDPEFAQRYNEAKEAGADILAERMRELAATPSDHPDDVAHRKLQLDTDKWLLARWHPNRYGDRQQVEHSGQVQLSVFTGVPRSDGPKELGDEAPQGSSDG